MKKKATSKAKRKVNSNKTASIEIEKCQFDPTVPPYNDGAMGMFHCPECGEMVMAGVKHPDYSRLDEWIRDPIMGLGDNHDDA